MRVLITGATGFIGGNLAEELARRGYELVCLARKRGNSAFLGKLGARVIFGDVTDEAGLAGVPGCDIVVHCAAGVMENDLKKLRRVNVLGSENVCRLALRTKAKRLVYLSSVAVVSGNRAPELTEDLPYSATNNYGISKIEAEKVVLGFRQRGLSCAVIRPPMVYGEGEPHGLDLLMNLIRRRMFPLIDGGERLAHMVYVKNLVAALVMAMEREELLSGTFFAADNDALTMREAAGILASASNSPAPLVLPPVLSSLLTRVPVAGKKVSFFRKDRVYDISRIRSLGYSDVLPARQALARTAKWWYENKHVKNNDQIPISKSGLEIGKW